MKPLKDLQSQETKNLKRKIQLPNIATAKLTCMLGKLQLNHSKSKMSSNKRKGDSSESSSRRPPTEPRIGERPMVVMHLSWDRHPEIPVHLLLDSGAQIFTISEAIVRKYGIPCWRRQVPLKLNNLKVNQYLEQDGSIRGLCACATNSIMITKHSRCLLWSLHLIWCFHTGTFKYTSRQASLTIAPHLTPSGVT